MGSGPGHWIHVTAVDWLGGPVEHESQLTPAAMLLDRHCGEESPVAGDREPPPDERCLEQPLRLSEHGEPRSSRTFTETIQPPD